MMVPGHIEKVAPLAVHGKRLRAGGERLHELRAGDRVTRAELQERGEAPRSPTDSGAVTDLAPLLAGAPQQLQRAREVLPHDAVHEGEVVVGVRLRGIVQLRMA